MIRIKLTGSHIEALTMGYNDIVDQLDRDTDHHELLREHAIELRDRFDDMSKRQQGRYTLGLRASEAVAMYQTLQLRFMLTTYSANALRKLVQHIDGKHKSGVWTTQ